MKYRVVLTLAAVFCGLSPIPTSAQSITVDGPRLAREVTAIFANTRIVLNGSDSYIEFATPIVRFKKALTVPERGVSYNYGPNENYRDEYDFNIADVNTQSVSVVATPAGFNLVFSMESGGAEGVWRCVRRYERGNRSEECPELIAGGQVWNRPVQWTSPLVVVNLVPTVVDGGLGLRVNTVALAGRMAMTGSRPGGGPACGPTTECCNICGITSRYLVNLTDARSPFRREIANAFAEGRVRTSLALAVTVRLRNFGITGPIQSVRMNGNDLVVTR
jgi:hypothetical protein